MSEQFRSAQGRMKRVIVARLLPGTDLLEGLQAVCEKHGIHNGVIISAIGSLNGVRYCNVEALPQVKCGYGYGQVLYLDGPIELTGAGGVICSEYQRMASGIPGTMRSATSSVASGMQSRAEKPVPPVVTISSASFRSQISRIRSASSSRSSGSSA